MEALIKWGLADIAKLINHSVVDEALTRCTAMEEGNDYLQVDPKCNNFTRPTDTCPDACSGMSTLTMGECSSLEIRVKHCNFLKGTDAHDMEIYRNCSVPRGYIFIANFDTFSDSYHESRPGSSIDVSNLSELFTQLGYIVAGPYDNLSKFELIKAIENFRDDEALVKVDSCVVAIMSHGKGENYFLTSDNKVVSYHEVLESFNNQHAPLLLGKPKVFIFQSCRGSLSDSGVGPMPSFMQSARPSQRDGMRLGHTIPITSTPSFTDMYIIFSSVPGFVSYRCPDRGSWLIENICLEFMENAWKRDLESLMKLVSRRMKALSSDKGKKQSCETRNIGFDKLLYFNPKSSLNSMTGLFQALPPLPYPYSSTGQEESKKIFGAVSNNGSCSRNQSMEDEVDSQGDPKNVSHSQNDFPAESSSGGFKRQLSSSTNTEALRHCSALSVYMNIHNAPHMAEHLKSVESELRKLKRQKQTRKPGETQSQGF